MTSNTDPTFEGYVEGHGGWGAGGECTTCHRPAPRRSNFTDELGMHVRECERCLEISFARDTPVNGLAREVIHAAVLAARGEGADERVIRAAMEDALANRGDYVLAVQ